MKIDVLGCGSAFSCTQNTSALRVIDADNKQWLIDCGPTVPARAGRRTGRSHAIARGLRADVAAKEPSR